MKGAQLECYYSTQFIFYTRGKASSKTATGKNTASNAATKCWLQSFNLDSVNSESNQSPHVRRPLITWVFISKLIGLKSWKETNCVVRDIRYTLSPEDYYFLLHLLLRKKKGWKWLCCGRGWVAFGPLPQMADTCSFAFQLLSVSFFAVRWSAPVIPAASLHQNSRASAVKHLQASQWTSQTLAHLVNKGLQDESVQMWAEPRWVFFCVAPPIGKWIRSEWVRAETAELISNLCLFFLIRNSLLSQPQAKKVSRAKECWKEMTACIDKFIPVWEWIFFPKCHCAFLKLYPHE